LTDLAVTAGAWRPVAGQRLARRAWEDEAVLFNDVTGATHLLSAATLWLLERLQAAPSDTVALARALNAESDSGADVDADDLDALLHELHKMHLVEPC
jgi:PqqD family protein of HPr-rel-A system